MDSETDPPPAKKPCTDATAVAATAEPDANTLTETAKPDAKDGPAKEIPASGSVSEEQGGTNDGTHAASKAEPPSVTPDVGSPPTENKANANELETKTLTDRKNPQSAGAAKLNGYEASERAFAAVDHVDLSRVIEGIQECDFEIEEMTISANQKVMEIEKSLRESKKPVYYKRSELIQHIPEFWLTTLINHHHISHFINEADEDCLQYLKKLHVEEFDDSVSGFKISFLFEPNPYFENEVICKEISFGQSGVLRSKATPIRWRPGHDLTRVTEASASSSKSQPQSFFHWFLQNANPVQDKIAVFIRDDIWPNPLKYFQVHTEDSTIDVSSDGIMVDSSGEEDEDESILVLEEEKDEDFDMDEDEDLELLENEGELLDEDFEDESEEDLLLDEDDDEFDDEDDDDGIELIESRGFPKQRTVPKKAAPPVTTHGRPPTDKNLVPPSNQASKRGDGGAEVTDLSSHPRTTDGVQDHRRESPAVRSGEEKTVIWTSTKSGTEEANSASQKDSAKEQSTAASQKTGSPADRGEDAAPSEKMQPTGIATETKPDEKVPPPTPPPPTSTGGGS